MRLACFRSLVENLPTLDRLPRSSPQCVGQPLRMPDHEAMAALGLLDHVKGRRLDVAGRLEDHLHDLGGEEGLVLLRQHVRRWDIPECRVGGDAVEDTEALGHQGVCPFFGLIGREVVEEDVFGILARYADGPFLDSGGQYWSGSPYG